ncbi:hypothetical protein NE237_005843 [Protea cynaroides]|uniref:Glucan endo-1,3-beta-D-glucosidase n=1 Tax=Protea cynaroides TaxID=273540 RepID=A0A9Q0KLZ5_9MAGN|nr:hypothetical protein NE237_005843 [Protea cynaroides]
MDAIWLPTLLLLVGSLLIAFGLCYGMKGNNLPSPKEVVDLYKSKNITRMRLYGPNQAILEALKDSNIELMMDVPISDLQNLANSNITEIDWILVNVMNYLLDFMLSLLATWLITFVLPAMQYIYNAILAFGLQDQIKVSTVINTQLLGTSYTPSQGAFRADVRSFIHPILLFLVQKESYLQIDTSLDYAWFTFQSSQPVVVQDGDLGYQNLFDSMVDSLYSAVEMVVEIVVSETGWPSAGGIGATTENAKIYNSNLIQHVKGGTPKRPGKAIETYVFSMFDENQKNNIEIDKEEVEEGVDFYCFTERRSSISFGVTTMATEPNLSSWTDMLLTFMKFLEQTAPSALFPARRRVVSTEED